MGFIYYLHLSSVYIIYFIGQFEIKIVKDRRQINDEKAPNRAQRICSLTWSVMLI